MRHPTNLDQYVNDPGGIERAELVEAHLEECQRCRSKLDKIAGVDFGRVRQGLHTNISAGETSRKWLSAVPGPAVAFAAFVLVLASGGLALWLSSGPNTGADVVDATTTTAAPTTTQPPLHFAERQAFELVWELSSGDVGHFLWIAEGRWSGVRLSTEGPMPEQRYRMGRDMDSRFTSIDEDLVSGIEGLTGTSEVSSDGSPTEIDITVDTDIPYPLLLEPVEMESWAEQLGGDWPVNAERADPTHPEAAVAWTSGTHRIEFSFDGIPVLFSNADETFSVIALDRRKIDRIELQTNLAPMIAAWLSTITTPEQKTALADAWVTQQEWLDGLTAAATCSDRSFDLSAADEAQADWFSPDCWEAHAVDVVLVRDLQRDKVPWDQVEVLFYEMTDMGAMAAVMAAEPEPMVRLTAPSGVAFSLGKRGDGWCFSSSAGNTGTEACTHPDFWQVPGVLEFSPGWGSDGWGEVQGLAIPDVVLVLIEYADGSTAEVQTFGHDAGLGAVAYYHSYNWHDNGAAIAGSAVDAAGDVIARFDFQADYCSPDAEEHRLEGPVTDSMCGDGGG